MKSIENVVNGLNTALFFKFTHGLNQHYMNNMIGPLYQRLITVKRLGNDFSQFEIKLDEIQKKCQKNNFSDSLKPISNTFNEAKTEFEKFKISPMDKNEYVKKILVATFELDRLEKVNNEILKYKENKSEKLSGQEVQELNYIYESNLRRIIRIQYNHPILQTAHFDFSSRKFLKMAEDLYVTESETFVNDDRIFYGMENLEKEIDIIPSGKKELELSVPFFVKNKNTPDRYKKYYETFYKRILNPKHQVFKDVLSFTEKASEVSMDQYFDSLSRKCENDNPCRTLATDPDYAARKMNVMKLTANLAPLACLCRIEFNRESVSGTQNVMLGIGGVGSIILAALFPESIPLAYTAYGVNGVGAVTSAMGIYDGVVNKESAEELAQDRSGGAVLESDFINTLNSEYQAKFEQNYNNITGVIGMLPPGKIAVSATHVPVGEIVKSKAFAARLTKEAALSSTVAPPPNLEDANYSDEWNPRKVYAPLSAEFRVHYPLLSKNLDRSMSDKVLAKNQTEVFQILAALKKAASEMLSDKKSADLLEKGIILRKNLPANLKNLDLPFLQ
ncbi:MAG: hypothetical protein ACXVLQ_04970 [Bacteriovorax sp.]